jgi:1,2-diacylglycerol 3-alpha-glucosyltransferase
MSSRPIKLGLISCGLGRVNRGFEVSTARWFEALKSQNNLDVRLFCGGSHEGGATVWNINRDSLLAGPFSCLPFISEHKRWETSYIIEQISFAFALLPKLINWRPDVLWTKEVPLAHFLDAFRRPFCLPYKIIFANGGAFQPSTYEHFDYIQHLQADSYQEGLDYGIAAGKMTTICNLVPQISVSESVSDIKASFGYHDRNWIVLCVAAWNSHHKRIDYLINEVANLHDPDVRLVLCGHPEPDTPALKKLAQEKLPGQVKWLTLPVEHIPRVLHMSDVFVLPTLQECLGGSLLEAAMAGVPLITHPHSGARFILQDTNWMTDLSQIGNLTRKLKQLKDEPPSTEARAQLHRQTISRFNQPDLVADFMRMLSRLEYRPDKTTVQNAAQFRST